MMLLVSDIFCVGIILLMYFLGSYLQCWTVASYNDIEGVLMSVYSSQFIALVRYVIYICRLYSPSHIL